MRTAKTAFEYEGRRSRQETVAAINSANDVAARSHQHLARLHAVSAIAIIQRATDTSREMAIEHSMHRQATARHLEPLLRRLGEQFRH